MRCRIARKDGRLTPGRGPAIAPTMDEPPKLLRSIVGATLVVALPAVVTLRWSGLVLALPANLWSLGGGALTTPANLVPISRVLPRYRFPFSRNDLLFAWSFSGYSSDSWSNPNGLDIHEFANTERRQLATIPTMFDSSKWKPWI